MSQSISTDLTVPVPSTVRMSNSAHGGPLSLRVQIQT